MNLPSRQPKQLAMHYRSSPTLGLLLLAAATASACGQSQGATGSRPQGAAAEEDSSVPLVVSVKVAEEDLSFTVTVPGSVRALESAELYAKVGGYLEKMEVDIGAGVHN